MPTIGVSLGVPEPWGSRLQDFRVSNGDVLGASIPSHITLVPPLEVASDRLTEVGRHLDSVARATTPYPIHLRGTGTFRPISPVVFVNLAQGISQTEQLAHACRSGPLATELHHPYHPHVTVAHHLDDPRLDRAFEELATFDCAFTADAFHLYVHDVDHGWRPTRDFHLAGPAR